MLFHKQSKQAVIQPPKTGTTTARSFLEKNGWKQLGLRHSDPEFLLEKYPNLNNYQIYGFLRNPLARFESAVLHLIFKKPPELPTFINERLKKVLEQHGIDSTENVSYETIIDIFPSMKEEFPNFFKPQANWFKNEKFIVLDFDNFESELRRIVGNYSEPVEKLNSSDNFVRGEVTQKVLDFVRQEYATDYVLAKDRLGKEY